MNNNLKEKQLYKEGNYVDCLEQLYKRKTKVKVLIWSMIAFSYILDILLVVLAKVLSSEIQSGNLSAIILLCLLAAGVVAAVAAVAGVVAGVVAVAAVVVVAVGVVVAGVAAVVVAAAGVAAVVVAAVVVVAGVVAVDDRLIKRICKWGLR